MPAHKVFAAIAAGLDYLDADLEQFLCEGPGSRLMAGTAREIVRASGYRYCNDARRIAVRTLYRLGWEAQRPVLHPNHTVWRRSVTPQVPRPGFEPVVRRRLRELLLAERAHLPSTLTLDAVFERLGLAHMRCPAVESLLASEFKVAGWPLHTYRFLGKPPIVAWERPRERAPLTAMRQPIIDAPHAGASTRGARKTPLTPRKPGAVDGVERRRRGLLMR